MNRAIRQAIDERRAFSWINTREVCQHWQAYFAAL